MAERHLGRKLAVIGAVAFAILVPAIQALTGWGQSAAEFSAGGDGTLRAAGYAFSIWSVIYAGLVAYAVYQVRGAPSPLCWMPWAGLPLLRPSAAASGSSPRPPTWTGPP